MSDPAKNDTPQKGQASPSPAVSARELRRDFEFMPATLEVLDRPPAPFARAMLIFIVVFAAFLIGWSCWAKMDIVVSGTGVVIPKGKVKVVQPLEPGIVSAIHVRDGQLVKRGDLLISMDNTDSTNDINTLENELSKSELTLLRLRAQLDEDEALFVPPDTADPQTVSLHRRLLEHSLMGQKERIDTLDLEIRRCVAERNTLKTNVSRLSQTVPLTREIYNKKTALAERKLISGAELIQAKIEMNDAKSSLLSAKSSLEEVEARLERAKEEKNLATTEYRRDILDLLAKEKNTWKNLKHEQQKAANKQMHLDLKAPADGIVQQLAINTIGGVVTAAQPLLVIVPVDSGLEIEAKILNKDIGFIAREQEVSVKVSAYPFTRYGDLKGSIEWVARDAVIDQDLGPSYPIRVNINEYSLPNIINGRQGILSPGMTVTTDIKVGRRRLIHYFLGPIFRYKDTSLREI